MAAGTPVIASSSGGLIDILSSPEVGRAVPPRDIAALTSALLELASDSALRVRLGTSGREHVRRHFSWSRLAKRAVVHYKSASLVGAA
jgi:glycosyltransferase involved in cell wall biosynthesis